MYIFGIYLNLKYNFQKQIKLFFNRNIDDKLPCIDLLCHSIRNTSKKKKKRKLAFFQGFGKINKIKIFELRAALK